ncbi:PREDICTED: uncharacterized protein LOC106107222 [Papilio polytes]|uniref:uncharacterized protein LOC106107222 n=1 Tax=Papilio polytes TaxID=76194 RepID=UPI000675EC96|nr:PREDICTED: uncharacterized protein LOC106107222 [Papilio polytes]
MIYKISLLVLFGVFGTTTAQLRCYACSFSSVDSDQSCLTITNSTPSVDCRFTYCTIMRQEFIDPIGVVASFTRGCEESPDFLNHEVVDPTFKTYYRACTNDLCNIGNGIQSVVGGSLSPSPEYNGVNLLVPGTGKGMNIQNNIFLLIITLSLYLLNA